MDPEPSSPKLPKAAPRARAGKPPPAPAIPPDQPRPMTGDEARIRTEYLPLDQVPPALRNPKRHDLDAIEASFAAHGFYQAVVVDERTGRLVAGHGRLEALRRRRDRGGREAPPGIILGPDSAWLVPVSRGWRSRDDQEAEEVMLADNRLVELGGYDLQVLLTMLKGIAVKNATLHGTGYNPGDLHALLRKIGPKPDGEEDAVPKLPTKPVTQLGDLWTLGRHRLLCGDASHDETIARLLAPGPGQGPEPAKVDLVITDPPYAIYGSSTGVDSDVTDDRITAPFFEGLFARIGAVLPEFGHAYVCCDWRTWARLWEAAKRARVIPKNLIVWDKNNGLGAMYQNYYELVGFFVAQRAHRTMAGNNPVGQRIVHRPNVIRAKPVAPHDKLHNAQKPVALFAEFVRNSSADGGLVFDPYLGSGTTLIACERMSRRCFGIDVEPRWCDVTVERWEKMTGEKATRTSAT